MLLTIKNNTSGTRSYLGGFITVAEASQVSISRDLNVIITQDAQFISDITSNAITLNDGSTDHGAASAITLIKILATYVTDPIASLFLYYSASVNVRQTTAAASSTTVWAMRNPLASPFNIVIERIQFKMSFDNLTPLGAKLLRYELVRFNTATPTGGTQITPIKASSIAPASAADVRFLDTGLSTTSVVFEGPFSIINCPAVQGAVSDYQRNNVCIKLAPGEGLAIRVSDVAASVGQALSGEIVWSLR